MMLRMPKRNLYLNQVIKQIPPDLETAKTIGGLKMTKADPLTMKTVFSNF